MADNTWIDEIETAIFVPEKSTKGTCRIVAFGYWFWGDFFGFSVLLFSRSISPKTAILFNLSLFSEESRALPAENE